MEKIMTSPIRCGDKVVSDPATHNHGNVHLGDWAPIFSPRPVRSGDKVVRDSATHNQGKVHLGDWAPIFSR
jgi:hypothetical protein